jgi:hypothetical protein
MRNETRTQYNAYLANLARLSGVSTAVEKYTVTPSVQQRLETAMQESSGFLQRIQIIGVDELKGENRYWRHRHHRRPHQHCDH